MIVPAVIPALTDGLRKVAKVVTNGPHALPQSVDDQIRLMEADVKRLERLAKIDTPPGSISQWVNNFRGAFRYAAILLLIIATIAAAFSNLQPVVTDYFFDITAASISFIIGERMYLRLRQ